ncbi:MAG: hypothetical protein AAF984_03980 [Verrucomicrobiota bacterium]
MKSVLHNKSIGLLTAKVLLLVGTPWISLYADTELPAKGNIASYELLWKNSPFERLALPETQAGVQTDYILVGSAGNDKERHVIVLNKKDQKRHLISNTSDDDKNKLLAYNANTERTKVTARVMINGSAYTVSYDQKYLQSGPKLPVKNIASSRTSSRPSPVARKPIVNRPTIPKTPTRPTNAEQSENQNQPRPVVRPRIIRK